MGVTEVGTAGMVLAFVCCLATVGLGLAKHRLAATALRSANFFGLVAVGVLVFALIDGAFELVYVADTTTRATALPYRVSGLWGAMEGSLLFWSWLHLALGSLAVGRVRRNQPEAAASVAAVVSAVAATELGLGLWFSFPFATLSIPAVDGGGLVAVLRHPAMIIHPPLLYLGLTMTLVPFAMLVAAARHGESHRLMGGMTPWIRAAWLLLTLGMLIGASWAYVEAGWGGFWAWDAVENTSLLPWLALTGALHAGRPSPDNRPLVLFVLTAFASTAMGVVLTRSGTTGSVHAFAEATATGRGLLVLTIGVLILAATVAWRLADHRASATVSPAEPLAPYVRLNNLVLAAAWFVVAAGTFVPSVSRLLGGPASTSGADFYVRFAGPVALVGLVGLILLFAGERLTVRRALIASLIPATGVLIAVMTDRSPVAVAVVISSVFAITFMVGAGVSALTARPGIMKPWLVVAHLGLAILLGAAAASTLGRRAQGVVAVGETLAVGDENFTVDSITSGEADEYRFIRVTLNTEDNPEPIVTELRRYGSQIRPSTEAALVTGAREDTLVILQDVAADAGSARLSILVKPLVMWVWVGGVTMMIGALGHGLRSRSASAEDPTGERQHLAATEGQRPTATTT